MTSQKLFTVVWKKYGIRVHLYKDDWYGHVLQRHFADMNGKAKLVETALKDCFHRNQLVQWLADPENEFFVQYKCPHFEPYNNFLRVVMRQDGPKNAKVVTAFPVKAMPAEGVKTYEPS